MTGDELTQGILTFFAYLAAICFPAALAAFFRRYAPFKAVPVSLAASIILTPLIYLGGFILMWGVGVYNSWDGSKELSSLIIFPASKAFFCSAYAALVGTAFSLFSIPVSRNRKQLEHHYWIFVVFAFGMSIFFALAEIEQEKSISQKTDSQQSMPAPQMAPLPATSVDSQLLAERNFDAMLVQLESKSNRVNSRSPHYDERTVLRIEARVTSLVEQGYPPTLALKWAAKEITGVDLSIPSAVSESDRR